MRIMVTGSDGYIGRGIVQLLLEHGHDVEAYGLGPCGLESEKLQEHIGDVFECDFAAMSEKPDVLLHLAWRNGFNHRDISHLEDLPKHYLLFERALEAGVGRIAAMGTMHEVGYHEGSVDENTPCNPSTPYGVAKNALRQLTLGMCAGTGAKAQWLRGFYLVSADGRGDSIFAKIVKADRAGQELFPFTSGKCRYDFLPYETFCSQVVAAVEQEKVCGVINICSGKSVALGDYIEGFIEENGLSVRLDYGKYPDRPYDSPAIWGDSQKIDSILRSCANRTFAGSTEEVRR